MSCFRIIKNKRFIHWFIRMVFLTVLSVFLSFSFLPGNYGQVLAADPLDRLAEQAVINCYHCYLETEGAISSSSNLKLDLYGSFILTEANVAVEQWSYGESNLKASALALITDTLTKEADEDPENDVNAKYVAYQYLVAKGLGENYLAQELLDILIERQDENGDGTFFNGAYHQWTNLTVFDVLIRDDVVTQLDMENSIDYILSLKSEEAGNFSDFMSTAQAVRSLFVLKTNEPAHRTAEVEAAISESVAWMKAQLREDGSVFFVGDDAVTDTAETILTLKVLGIDVDSWEHEVTGNTPLDYMLNDAKNPDGTFGSGNMGSNIWALTAFNCLGAKVEGDTALKVSIIPEMAELAVDEEQEFTATAFLANGNTVNVTTIAEWSVSDPDKAELNLVDDKMVVRRVSAGDFEIDVLYQLVNCKVVAGTREEKAGTRITIRIEAPDYTILPDTVIEMPKPSSYLEVLRAGQTVCDYQITEHQSGYLETINGLGNDFYWSVAPYQDIYQDGDSFVMSANNSTKLGELNLSATEASTSTTLTATVKNNSDEPVEGATVIYYTAEKRNSPTIAGITDANGELDFRIEEKGTYFVAADKANTAEYPDDNGLVRTVAQEIVINKSSSGGGGSNPSTNKIKVSVKVNGENGERLFNGKVTLDKKKATVFDALVATGLSYEGDSNFISAIEGQKNRGMNGWMVKINGKLISFSIGSYTLKDGDSVQWFYSSDSDNNVEGIGGNKKSPTPDLENFKPEEEREEVIIDPETYRRLFAKAEELHTNFQKRVTQLMREAVAYLVWLGNCLKEVEGLL
jgi:hypothetical protein